MSPISDAPLKLDDLECKAQQTKPDKPAFVSKLPLWKPKPKGPVMVPFLSRFIQYYCSHGIGAGASPTEGSRTHATQDSHGKGIKLAALPQSLKLNGRVKREYEMTHCESTGLGPAGAQRRQVFCQNLQFPHSALGLTSIRKCTTSNEFDHFQIC